MAVETEVTPINGSYPFHTWSTTPTYGYANNGANKATNYPSNSAACIGNGVPSILQICHFNEARSLRLPLEL
ncbi:hypothetical protein QQ045_008535 [Rhodiola kirilowii]